MNRFQPKKMKINIKLRNQIKKIKNSLQILSNFLLKNLLLEKI